MIIRKIKPEELKRTSELFGVAFEFETDNSKTAQEVYDETIAHPETRDNRYWMERYAAFEDDNKTMMSFFAAKPYPVHFDGCHCQMTGIGGVATLPQYRRRGGIRSCFEQALLDMYQAGYEFSYLYPFSTAYYRKFGYELCCETYSYKLRLSFLPNYSVDGYTELAEPGNLHLEEVTAIHQTWQSRYNMMVENEDCDYEWLKNANPVKTQEYTYIYKDKDGLPKGYLCFRNQDEREGRTLQCSRFVYTDTEGFRGLLALARSFSSDHLYISFSLPTDLYIPALIPEWSMGAGSCRRMFSGMARVIHAEKVFMAARYQGEGSLSIGITDPYIEENNGTFHISFSNGRAQKVRRDQSPSDISMGIQDFSRLIIGVLDTGAIPYLPDVTIHNQSAAIEQVFFKKPVMITEYF